jgi:hypothetical protein
MSSSVDLRGGVKTAGKVMSFYAPAGLAAAIERHIDVDREGKRGEASAWFCEAARRDLKARGLPDGSPANDPRDQLFRSFQELLAACPDEAHPEVEAMLQKLRTEIVESAGIMEAGK